jgi:hypothetical protein
VLEDLLTTEETAAVKWLAIEILDHPWPLFERSRYGLGPGATQRSDPVELASVVDEKSARGNENSKQLDEVSEA